MNDTLIAALRAHAAGLLAEEAATELLISNGTILHRDDFAIFIDSGPSISDGTTMMAWIDWHRALSALINGRLPLSGGERRILKLAVSLAAGTPVSLHASITGLDHPNLEHLVTAIRHATGHPSAYR